MPGLPDPNFFKSVILLVDHNARGAFGLIINRPCDLSLASILDENAPYLPPDIGAWYGGPVEPNLGIILKRKKNPAEDEIPFELLSSNQALQDLATVHHLARRSPLADFDQRFIVGSAGWGPKQLDQELKGGSWLELPYSEDLVFRTPSDRLWRDAFASMGIIPDNVIPLHRRLPH